MNLNKVLVMFAGVFNQKNFKAFDKAVSEFSKGLSDFGSAMSSVNNELSDDITKSDFNRKARERIDKENLERIWGKKR